MKRIANVLGTFSQRKMASAVFVLCATTAIALPAQTFTTLHSFDNADGSNPYAGFVQGTDGNLYGTTFNGGANAPNGTVFKITPSGTLTTLYSFCSAIGCTDGSGPTAPLVQGTAGNFYGTTYVGGADGQGTVFKITPSGTLTTLYNFCGAIGCTDGGPFLAGLVQAINGDFYGTTFNGGVNHFGSVFRMTPGGTLTTLYSFCSQTGCTGFQYPSALIQATNGDLYGTTAGSLTDGSYGTIFKITPSGTLTTLYSFCSQSGCLDGEGPWGLVQATNGDFYGMTELGGANNQGTVFKVTPSGALTTLYNFCSQSGCTDGSPGFQALVQGTDGNFYGTTQYGGANNAGTTFKITSSGTLTTLYSFCSQTGCTDGSSPIAGLVQATNGKFYGMTPSGGTHNIGTVFALSVGLGPFVETQPTSGNVGEVVRILGSNLSGATSVSFNGATAVFELVSSTEIITTVPVGATSGRVQVVTPRRTLSSNMLFRVRP